MNIKPTLSISLLAMLLACAVPAQAQSAQNTPTDVTDAPDDHGAYLSVVFGNGRIEGGNASGYTWMRGRTFEVRAGEQQRTLFGLALPLPASTALRTDFVHYNEGHPDNNHRDGFALQWLMVRQLGARGAVELGVGPYLSMNTTVIDGRQIDDAHVGVLASLALRLALPGTSGTHLRLACLCAHADPCVLARDGPGLRQGHQAARRAARRRCTGRTVVLQRPGDIGMERRRRIHRPGLGQFDGGQA